MQAFLPQQGYQKGWIQLFLEIRKQLLQGGLPQCRIDDFLSTLYLTLLCRTAWQSHVSHFPGYFRSNTSSEIQGPPAAQLQKKCSFWSLCICSFFHILPSCPIKKFIYYPLYTELCFGKNSKTHPLPL